MYRYNVGDVVNDFVIIEKIIIKQKSKNTKSGFANQKGYVVKCLKCGHVYERLEVKILYNKSCPICLNYTCIKGINDIATTHPNLVKYFVNKKNAEECTFGSSKKFEMACPNCGNRKTLTANKLSKNGFGCQKCSDKIPYPERFIVKLLNILNVEYTRQLNRSSFEWCDKYYYDFFLPSINTIVETHGGQHYSNVKNWRGLEYERENDNSKYIIAKENGISHYIVLDCRKSELNWIKNSIMNSELPRLLNFKEEDVDWIECDKLSMSSIMVDVCMRWNNRGEYDTTVTLASEFGVSSCTILEYVKRGNDIGLCSYDANNEKKLATLKSTMVNKKSHRKVICNNKIFNTISECARFYDVNRSTMGSWLDGSRHMPEDFENMGLAYLQPTPKIACFKEEIKL